MFGVRTPFPHLVFSNTPLPASNNFWTKIQLSKKSDAFLSANILLSLIIFFNLLYSISKIALPRYSRVSYKKLNGWEFGHWLTANFTFLLWRGKILSDHFQCPCDVINNFQDKLPALLSSFLECLSLRVPQAFLWRGGKVMLVFEIIYLFSDLQVIFYGQMTSIINNTLL